jgi:nifR3 family TIM-barrel protein
MKNQPTFYIDHIPVYGDLILSPMDGYSDLPFRSLCRQLGSALSYTEFVNATDILGDRQKFVSKLIYAENERPVVFQIYGDDPDQMMEAALQVQDRGPDIIDINMGCPSKSVSARGAGAGLMRTPLKIARIFRKLSAALDVPVTGKIRLGWDDDCRTYALVARIVEENGGSLIAVHARTKKQGYGGQADWDAIAEVQGAVSIPVIGNGDVRTCADISRIKEQTGCVGVMIGRAAIGNPWIFSRLDREQVPPERVWETMLTHLNRNLDFYGPKFGLIRFRKHAVSYLAPYHLPRVTRQKLLTRETPGEFITLLDETTSDIFKESN